MPIRTCLCVCGRAGRAAALSVQSVTLWHRRLFHVPPGPGEAVSGQGARSQGSHTAAHCPGLRAASQRRGGGGGWPLGPPLWGYVFRALGVAAGSGRPERASSPQLPATRLRRWAKAALTAAPSGAACKEGAHCLVRTLTRGFRKTNNASVPIQCCSDVVPRTKELCHFAILIENGKKESLNLSLRVEIES